jgi:hypothetical protein
LVKDGKRWLPFHTTKWCCNIITTLLTLFLQIEAILALLLSPNLVRLGLDDLGKTSFYLSSAIPG